MLLLALSYALCACNEIFFWFGVIIFHLFKFLDYDQKKKKKALTLSFREIDLFRLSKWTKKFFFFLIEFLDKFVLKTWISSRVSYFVDNLSGVGDIFLPCCP